MPTECHISRGGFWAHPSQFPAAVTATLEATSRVLDADDAAIEAAVLRSLRETRLSQKIPALISALQKNHPDLSQRAIFRLLEVKTGLSSSYVEKLYYRHKQEMAACS